MNPDRVILLTWLSGQQEVYVGNNALPDFLQAMEEIDYFVPYTAGECGVVLEGQTPMGTYVFLTAANVSAD